ncbi:MAG: aldehyde dehydrogenase family protein [Myxococcaceae bacterium]|nr:aldehyde dehydrogenase family protein [Myxococcaceae bacterium]
MVSTSLVSYIAGAREQPASNATRIRSFDGEHELIVAETSPVLLRRALRYADECQPRLEASSMEERIEVARLLVRDYEQQADAACWALAHFRGLTAADTRWMCQVNARWSEDFEALVGVMWGHSARPGPLSQARPGTMFLRSKGKAALFSSSTMDGPPAVVALCHAILSGTHLILKPSFRDAATHLAFETLHRNGLQHYAQLVRWRSDAPEAQALNRTLINQVAQAVIFSSNESYRAVLDGAATPGSAEWDALQSRVKRYGTGLPLAIVTPACDLDSAARDLVEGARLGGGRFCLSACPVLVDRRCHDALLERIVARARRLVGGSRLAPETELSGIDPADAQALRETLRSFGGSHVFGAIRAADMDVQVLSQVPISTAALHRELPGTALALIPVDDLAQSLDVAVRSLGRNFRTAWTALVCFGSDAELALCSQSVPAFRYLRGGVVARVKLLLPHQGEYFALDLMRRVTVE